MPLPIVSSLLGRIWLVVETEQRGCDAVEVSWHRHQPLDSIKFSFCICLYLLIGDGLGGESGEGVVGSISATRPYRTRHPYRFCRRVIFVLVATINGKVIN
jgi:hypothetical protein